MENTFIEIASLIGDPTRASIMWTLLDGKAMTATELAMAAETSPQNISMHLAKLVKAELLVTESQGRHRYYSFAGKEIAYAIEALANLVSPAVITKKIKAAGTPPVKYCRSCYDHLAGEVGVLITESLLRQKIIIAGDNHYKLSKKGEKWFDDFGISTIDLKEERRSFLRPCLDWSERRHHMAGSLSAAFLDKLLSIDWIRRTKNSRVIVITSKGRKGLYERFKVKVD